MKIPIVLWPGVSGILLGDLPFALGQTTTKDLREDFQTVFYTDHTPMHEKFSCQKSKGLNTYSVSEAWECP